MENIKVKGYSLTFTSAMAAREFVHDYLNTSTGFYRLVCIYENRGRLKPSGITANDGFYLDGFCHSISKEMLEQVK